MDQISGHPRIRPALISNLSAQVKDKHVDYTTAPGIFVVSCLSLMFGFSVGPEQALGTFGGALGTWIAERRKLPPKEHHSATLNGMAGAMGALFPCPILSVMLIHELSIQAAEYWPNYMDAMVSGCIAATSAWMVFVSVQDYTFLEPVNLPAAVYDFSNFEMWMMGSAVLLGIVGGVMGFIVLMTMGIFRGIAATNMQRLETRFPKYGTTVGTILLPTIGRASLQTVIEIVPWCP